MSEAGHGVRVAQRSVLIGGEHGDADVAEQVRQPFAVRPQVTVATAARERHLDARLKGAAVDRLEHVAVSGGLRRALEDAPLAVTRHVDGADVEIVLEPFGEHDAVESAVELHVNQREVGLQLLGVRERGLAGEGNADHRVARIAHECRDLFGAHALVFDDQDVCQELDSSVLAKRKQKSVPCPSSDANVSFPESCSASSRTKRRPRPVRTSRLVRRHADAVVNDAQHQIVAAVAAAERYTHASVPSGGKSVIERVLHELADAEADRGHLAEGERNAVRLDVDANAMVSAARAFRLAYDLVQVGACVLCVRSAGFGTPRYRVEQRDDPDATSARAKESLGLRILRLAHRHAEQRVDEAEIVDDAMTN